MFGLGFFRFLYSLLVLVGCGFVDFTYAWVGDAGGWEGLVIAVWIFPGWVNGLLYNIKREGLFELAMRKQS